MKPWNSASWQSFEGHQSLFRVSFRGNPQCYLQNRLGRASPTNGLVNVLSWGFLKIPWTSLSILWWHHIKFPIVDWCSSRTFANLCSWEMSSVPSNQLFIHSSSYPLAWDCYFTCTNFKWSRCSLGILSLNSFNISRSIQFAFAHSAGNGCL